MLFLVLFVVLLMGWIFGFALLHLAGGVHLLLVLAVSSLIVHFVRVGTRSPVL